MNCLEFEQTLPLYLYSELSDVERAACEAHLEACANCRAVLRKTEDLHKTLAALPRPEPTAALLAESRLQLDAALDHEQHGWRALLRNWPPVWRLEPASRFALAMTLVFCGFGLGWGLRPHAGRVAHDVNTAVVANPDLENLRINGISRVAPDPKTGGVRITMDAERRVALDGQFNDPQIQQVLIYAMKNYDNAGIRRDTLDALRAHLDNPSIRQALLYALRHDSNPGVRLETLEAVRDLGSNQDVHSALLDALQHDTNPGVRVAAVNALIENTEKEGGDLPQALEALATTDRNPYVRLKCSNAMMRLGK
jgi:hypothetical protein